jgi:flagella basal body P-ring formation protein FlgA
MNLSLKRNFITVLLTLMLIPLGISRSLAVNSITTESFISELKTKIRDTFRVTDENIEIKWTDDALEQKVAEIKKFYPGKNVNITVNDVIIKDISGRSGLPVNVLVDEKLNRILYLKCKVEVFKEVLVAKSNIKRGDVITDDLLEYSRLPVKQMQVNASKVKLEDVVGKVAAVDINEKTVITSNYLKEKTVIFRGNQVTIRLVNGELTLTSVGEALQDGYIGQKIQVKVVGAKATKILMAKVLDTDLVEIDLGGNN